MFDHDSKTNAVEQSQAHYTYSAQSLETKYQNTNEVTGCKQSHIWHQVYGHKKPSMMDVMLTLHENG